MLPVILQPEKVATPALAGTAARQDWVDPVVGWDPMANVTPALDEVTVLFPTSWTVTTGCVVKATPSTAPAGWVEKMSFDAAPTASTNEFDPMEVTPDAEAVSEYVPVVPVSVQDAKVATPDTAVIGPQPVNDAPDDTMDTDSDEVVTVFPPTSTTRTTGWVVKARPSVVPAGWVEKERAVAAPSVNVMLDDVAEVRPLEAADKV